MQMGEDGRACVHVDGVARRWERVTIVRASGWASMRPCGIGGFGRARMYDERTEMPECECVNASVVRSSCDDAMGMARGPTDRSKQREPVETAHGRAKCNKLPEDSRKHINERQNALEQSKHLLGCKSSPKIHRIIRIECEHTKATQ